VKRHPTKAEVHSFLEANARRLPDDRWDVPSLGVTAALFEPAALKLAETCLILGLPLSDVITADFALALARRIATLEETVEQCTADRKEVAA
jgi:hypothetical protein